MNEAVNEAKTFEKPKCGKWLQHNRPERRSNEELPENFLFESIGPMSIKLECPKKNVIDNCENLLKILLYW